MRKKNDIKEENGKLLLSVKETCELTGLSEKTVRTIMAENDFCVRIGRTTLIQTIKVELLLEVQDT